MEMRMITSVNVKNVTGSLQHLVDFCVTAPVFCVRARTSMRNHLMRPCSFGRLSGMLPRPIPRPQLSRPRRDPRPWASRPRRDRDLATMSETRPRRDPKWVSRFLRDRDPETESASLVILVLVYMTGQQLSIVNFCCSFVVCFALRPTHGTFLWTNSLISFCFCLLVYLFCKFAHCVQQVSSLFAGAPNPC